MIYLVSKNKRLFNSTRYEQIDFKKALDILTPLKLVQFDTETGGLDPHTKPLLTVQLGNKENQVVFDWATLNSQERKVLKDYFESDRVFLGCNLMFDVGFLYVQNIWTKHIWDVMIAEKLIFLGYPPALRVGIYEKLQYPQYTPKYNDKGEISSYELSYSLKAIAKRRCNIDIDKTVRGKIINEGLTEEVVVYAAGDVMWLEDIKAEQEKELKKQNLQKAMAFECEFVKSLAYAKYCGIHLDVDRWSKKMEHDLARLKKAENALNAWVVNWENERETPPEPIKYIDPNLIDTSVDEQWLLKQGYVRDRKNDRPNPKFPGNIMYAYKKKRIPRKYTIIDLQGDLFEGYNTDPKCIINWKSSNQVIPLFKDIGINVKTFDKETKKEKDSVEEKILAPQAKDFPIIPLYLDYQGAAKVVSTYGENWLNAINPKTGRIHVELHSIGTDTSRVSSGGGPYKLNLQNLPHDEETRSCFTAEKGNVWISCDYSGQESAITASVSKDPKMIEILSSGGDLHSEVAKSCWPDILGGLTDKEVKTQYKDLRSSAKGVEFGIFYGGTAHTLHMNKGFEMNEAQRIYNNFMNTFTGIKRYQDYCRKEVMLKGYILMNPILGHRAHIYDYPLLKNIMEKMEDRDFMNYYWDMRRNNPHCDTVRQVSKFNERKSNSERQSINYRIQNRGACCFKLASIKFFNWIIQNNYQNIVKMCAPVHDKH